MRKAKWAGLCLGLALGVFASQDGHADEMQPGSRSFAGFSLSGGLALSSQNIYDQTVALSSGGISAGQPDASGRGYSAELQAGYSVDPFKGFNLSANVFYGFGPQKIDNIVATLLQDEVSQDISNRFGFFVAPGVYVWDGTLLYAKAGISFADVRYTRDTFNLDIEQRLSGNLFGFGVKHLIDQNFFVSADFTRYLYGHSTIGSEETMGPYVVDVTAKASEDRVLLSLGYVF